MLTYDYANSDTKNLLKNRKFRQEKLTIHKCGKIG